MLVGAMKKLFIYRKITCWKLQMLKIHVHVYILDLINLWILIFKAKQIRVKEYWFIWLKYLSVQYILYKTCLMFSAKIL